MSELSMGVAREVTQPSCLREKEARGARGQVAEGRRARDDAPEEPGGAPNGANPGGGAACGKRKRQRETLGLERRIDAGDRAGTGGRRTRVPRRLRLGHRCFSS